MQYTMFGNTGMEVSRFCLGSMTFGSKIDKTQGLRIVDEALDHGVNFIDTADSYGESEEMLGEILSNGKRERLFLGTKVFRRFCRDEHVGRNSRVNIINSLERSLKLLQTDYVDLYQLHHPDPRTPIEETLQTLDSLVNAGKIRYIGVSNHYAWQMATMIGESKTHGWEPIVSIQANYNVLDRQIELETVPFCQRFNVALTCYGPLCGGVLTGKYEGGETIPPKSRAAGNKQLRAYLHDREIQEALKKLGALAADSGIAMNHLAIMWLLSKEVATSVILGGSKAKHFTDVYEIADETLSAEIAQAIDELSQPRVYSEYRNQPVQEGPQLGLQW